MCGMLLGYVNHVFQPGGYTIQYPMLRDFEIDYIDFPNYDFILKPMQLTKVVDGPRCYLTMSFSTVGYKSLYRKLMHHATQNIRISQNTIIDQIVHLYSEIAYLHSIPQLLGAISIHQLFYKEGQPKIYIAGFLNDDMKRLFPIVYHDSVELSLASDSLALAYVLYCLLTQRIPPIPFLCYFKLDRSMVDVYGNYNFFSYILRSNKAKFEDIKDHVIAKLCQQYNLLTPDPGVADYHILIPDLLECLEILKGANGLCEDGLMALVNM